MPHGRQIPIDGREHPRRTEVKSPPLASWGGMLAITAAIIVGLGRLFDSVWVAALVVGAVFVIVGWLLARSAMADVRHHAVTPERTVERDHPHRDASSHPPSKPARLSPVAMYGQCRMSRQMSSVRKFSIMSTAGPWVIA